MNGKQIVAAFFREGYETGRFERVLELLAPDYLDHSPAGAQGSREAVAILQAVREMFSDLQVTVLDLLEEGDRVASHVRFQAVHSGPCMGIEATGKAFSFSALGNFRI